jgi:predicted Holliday junction resolvase-like endonuclease
MTWLLIAVIIVLIIMIMWLRRVVLYMAEIQVEYNQIVSAMSNYENTWRQRRTSEFQWSEMKDMNPDLYNELLGAWRSMKFSAARAEQKISGFNPYKLF